MSLLDIVRVDLTRWKLFEFLTDDDLRFMYGVCSLLREMTYAELARRAGGKPSLAYTPAMLHISPAFLQRNPAMLKLHVEGNVGEDAECAYGHVETFEYVQNDAYSIEKYVQLAGAHGYLKLLRHLHEKYKTWKQPATYCTQYVETAT